MKRFNFSHCKLVYVVIAAVGTTDNVFMTRKKKTEKKKRILTRM